MKNILSIIENTRYDLLEIFFILYLLQSLYFRNAAQLTYKLCIHSLSRHYFLLLHEIPAPFEILYKL